MTTRKMPLAFQLLIGLTGLLALVRIVCATEMESLSKLNLKKSDVPGRYQLRPDKSGFTTDVLKYTEGDKKDAKRLKKLGWRAVDEIYFRTVDKKGVEVNNVYSALSIYRDNQKLASRLKNIEKVFVKDGGVPVKTSHTFGDKSILYRVQMDEEGIGKIHLYELRFYVDNVFANVEIGGPEGTLSQKEVEKYGRFIEKRLKEGL